MSSFQIRRSFSSPAVFLFSAIAVIFLCGTTSARSVYLATSKAGSSHVHQPEGDWLLVPSELNNPYTWDYISPNDTIYVCGEQGAFTPREGEENILTVYKSVKAIKPCPEHGPPLIYGALPIADWEWDRVAFREIDNNSSWDGWQGGVPADYPNYFGADNGTWAVKDSLGGNNHLVIDFQIASWLQTASAIKILSLCDGAGNEFAWIELSKSGEDSFVNFFVDDNPATAAATSTGPQALKPLFKPPFNRITVYAKQPGNDSDATVPYMLINGNKYEVQGTPEIPDNDTLKIQRLRAGFVGTLSGQYRDNETVMWLNDFAVSGDAAAATTLYRTARAPLMLWDDNGTVGFFDDDVEIQEDNTLSKRHKVWWCEGFDTDDDTYLETWTHSYLRLPEGLAPEQSGIVATVARGIYFSGDGAPSYDNMTLSGLTLEKCGGPRQGLSLWHIWAAAGALRFDNGPNVVNNLKIENCTINRTVGTAIHLRNCNNCEINDNKIDLTLPVWGNECRMGGGIMATGSDLEVYNNDISRAEFLGIDALGNNTSIHDNYLHGLPDKRIGGTDNPAAYYYPTCQGTNIHLEYEDPSTKDTLIKNTAVYNNLLVSTWQGIFVQDNYCGAVPGYEFKRVTDFKIYNNILIDQQRPEGAAVTIKYVSGVDFFNNAIISPRGGGIFVRGVGDLKIKNNIVHEPGKSFIRSVNYNYESDYNNLFDSSDPSYSSSFAFFNIYECTAPGCSETLCAGPGPATCEDNAAKALPGAWNFISYAGYTYPKPKYDSYIGGRRQLVSRAMFKTSSADNDTDQVQGTYKWMYPKDPAGSPATFDSYIVEVRIRFDAMGAFDPDNDSAPDNYFEMSFDNGPYVASVFFASDGIWTKDDGSFEKIVINSDDSLYDLYYEMDWTIEVRKRDTKGLHKLKIYRDGKEVTGTKSRSGVDIVLADSRTDHRGRTYFQTRLVQQSTQAQAFETYVRSFDVFQAVTSLKDWQRLAPYQDQNSNNNDPEIDVPQEMLPCRTYNFNPKPWILIESGTDDIPVLEDFFGFSRSFPVGIGPYESTHETSFSRN